MAHFNSFETIIINLLLTPLQNCKICDSLSEKFDKENMDKEFKVYHCFKLKQNYKVLFRYY